MHNNKMMKKTTFILDKQSNKLFKLIRNLIKMSKTEITKLTKLLKIVNMIYLKTHQQLKVKIQKNQKMKSNHQIHHRSKRDLKSSILN